MRKDVDIYGTNGAPLLKKSVGPHRNLTQSDMALQAKLDKINWSCFVPSCQNTKSMTDKKVVFFPVPDGKFYLRFLPYLTNYIQYFFSS